VRAKIPAADRLTERCSVSNSIKIDFVSDVSCPWCVIGLKSLEAALAHLAGKVEADIHFQPFELNPQMSAEGEDVAEHIARKYGSSSAQLAQSQEAIRARGAQLGFEFHFGKRSRIYNTFDAHRLLHWAEGSGKQKALKEALFTAYFSAGRDPSDHRVLEEIAAKAGLDAARARQILDSDEYAHEVRAREQHYLNQGIHAVPAVILNDRYLVQGGQPVEAFERALRQVADEMQVRPND
jgi:predicted DsbA family dithiol-disulfide isomerase